jgi:hypothetical protein
MKKKIIILFMTGFCSMAVGKNATKNNLEETFWVSIDNSEVRETYNFYYVYTHKYLYTCQPTRFDSTSIRMCRYLYGFYDDCDLPSIDSLNQSGDYYFEVDVSDFEKEQDGSQKYVGNCFGLSIFKDRQDTMMNIYWSSRQEIFTYKKINNLPGKIHDLLQENGIYVGFPCKEISSEKAIIYSAPNIPTRMYLIKGDVVTVLEKEEGWLRIDYEGKKQVRGWIKEQDVGSE